MIATVIAANAGINGCAVCVLSLWIPTFVGLTGK